MPKPGLVPAIVTSLPGSVPNPDLVSDIVSSLPRSVPCPDLFPAQFIVLGCPQHHSWASLLGSVLQQMIRLCYPWMCVFQREERLPVFCLFLWGQLYEHWRASCCVRTFHGQSGTWGRQGYFTGNAEVLTVNIVGVNSILSFYVFPIRLFDYFAVDIKKEYPSPKLALRETNVHMMEFIKLLDYLQNV